MEKTDFYMVTLDTYDHSSDLVDENEPTPEAHNGPYLAIIEQPKQRGFRFRYVCEGPSHGGLPGATSEKGRKTYPTVKLFNYIGMAKIEVDLVTHTDPPRVHAHSLVGKQTNEQGNYVVAVGPTDMTAQFNSLGIVHVTKKSQTDIVKLKMRQQLLRNRKTPLTEQEEKKIEQEVKELKKVTDLSIVRLRFTAYLPDSNGAFTLSLPPVISDPIHDSKSPGASNLRISRMDKTAGSVKGGDEVYLLCDKVQKDDIEVRFYEDDDNGWQAFGDFSPTDVHKQYAIVFRTPPYHKMKIDRPVTVFLQLKRKKGGDVSDSKQFTYYPLEQDKEEVERKKRKDLPTFNNHFYGGGAPMGGAGGGSGSFGLGGSSNMNFNFASLPPSYYSSGHVGGYQGGGHMMKDSAPVEPNERKETLENIKLENEESEPQRESAVSQQRIVHYRELWHQANMRMLSHVQRTSQALLDYARTSDPRMLLAVQRPLTSTRDENGDTPLHIAIIHGQTSVIHQLVHVIASIPNQQIINMRNHLHQTPLHLGVITQQYSVVTLLLRAGADPTILDRYGNSVFHLAVQARDEKMLNVLLTHMSTAHRNLLNMPDYHGLFPVHWAVKGKNEKCIEVLVNGGADVNAAERKSGRSPLHIAVEMDNLNMATFLIKRLGADINLRTFGGNTPLHLAASLGSPVLTKMLISAGADVYSENDEPMRVSAPYKRQSTDSDSDVTMDSDEEEDTDSDTSVDMDSESDHSGDDMGRRTHCTLKRKHPGHTPLDLAKTQKVREILCKHTPGSVARAPAAPESGNVLSLETNTVRRLEQILNDGQTGADWTELATRLRLQSLVDTYRNTPSPTERLLHSYELAGGSLKELITTLESMGLNEGVQLLCQSETYTKLRASEGKIDSAYGSQSVEGDQTMESQSTEPQKPTLQVTRTRSPTAELAANTKPASGK
ncbi:nuclear factor NF-kappa-B p100 subunit isoform X2 [Bombina bombina]|uniref:nuclear factor NF-kappa-B p100 subunit isoform X2 n=1 Tax=Bombina bombina TaxID=8345 RepID=UPI00235A8AF5|nr:nuclear factor NF-kappa-B p100 subunit isoform X2 [Bombina bombina]